MRSTRLCVQVSAAAAGKFASRCVCVFVVVATHETVTGPGALMSSVRRVSRHRCAVRRAMMPAGKKHKCVNAPGMHRAGALHINIMRCVRFVCAQ